MDLLASSFPPHCMRTKASIVSARAPRLRSWAFFPCCGKGQVGLLKMTGLVAGPGGWEGGGESRRPVGQLQTARNKKQATTSQGHVTSGLGSLCHTQQGCTVGRVGTQRGKNAGLSPA